jgi:hypothetical protein
VDEGVGARVALVLRKIEPHVPARDGDEPGKARFELMLPLLVESEPPVPVDRTRSVLDVENRYDLLLQATRP